jgi:hypothetical protein
MKVSQVLSSATVTAALSLGVFSGIATAQVGTPVTEVPKAEISEAANVTRTITVGADQSWANVGEFERVKFVGDGAERVVDFPGLSTETVEVGSKKLTVYVNVHPQFSSPGL